MILITGATGTIGQELSKLLAQSNIKARAMCQKKEELDQFIKMGLEAVVGNFNNPNSMKEAMQGCERLFLLAPAVPELSRYLKLAIDVAIEANIKHIVKLSVGDANLDSKIAWAKGNTEGDHYLRSKSTNWTILRPTGFMINLIEAKKAISNGVIPNPTANGKVSWIDHRDIARVAKSVLTEDSHNKAIYYLTGPEALSLNDIASILTQVLGFEVKSIPTTSADMQKTFLNAGLDKWRVSSLLEQYEMVKRAYALDVTEDVERITGNKPNTFQQFAQEFRNQWLD